LAIVGKGLAPPFFLAAYAGGAVLVLAPNLPAAAFLVGFTALLLAAAAKSSRLTDTLGSSAGSLFAVVYTCGPFLLARDLYTLSPHWLLAVLAVNWAGDSAAFYVGRSFGRRKLAPTLSPNKTWEGTIASLVCGSACGSAYLLYFELPGATAALAVGLALTANVAGQVGDLAESALKRSVKLKDSGALLPGHGGMLDRMDSALFALPAAYLFLMLARLL
jgi:phosphatidate cytidylyltransferase